jgi:hypothetical protein
MSFCMFRFETKSVGMYDSIMPKYCRFLVIGTFSKPDVPWNLPNKELYTNSMLFWYRFGLVYVFYVTFSNISDIAWWSVLLVKETGVPGENLS